jgi:hypothetical protein
MPLIYEAQCPQCLSTLNLSAMYRTAETNRWGLIVEDLAVICGNCGARLRIEQTRMALAQLALVGSLAGATACGAWFVTHGYKGLGFVIPICFFAFPLLRVALARRYLPHLVGLRFLRDAEIPQFPNPKTLAKSDPAARWQ